MSPRKRWNSGEPGVPGMFKQNGELHSVKGRLLENPWLPPEFITENLNRHVPTESYLYGYLVHNPRAPRWLWDCGVEKWGFQCDLFCSEAALDVEADGDSHSEMIQMVNDVKRELTYQKHGIRILRFANADVCRDPERVFKAVAKIYRGRCRAADLTLPTPSKQTNLGRILERARTVYYGRERRELADAVRAKMNGLFDNSPDLREFLARLER